MTAVSPSLAAPGELEDARRDRDARSAPTTSSSSRTRSRTRATRRTHADRCFHCKSELYRHRATRSSAEWGLARRRQRHQPRRSRRLPPRPRGREEGRRAEPARRGRLHQGRRPRSARAAIGLAVWDKPAAACLSSRMPYGTSRHARAPRADRQVSRPISSARISAKCACAITTKLARVETSLEELARAVDPSNARTPSSRPASGTDFTTSPRSRRLPHGQPQRSAGRQVAARRVAGLSETGPAPRDPMPAERTAAKSVQAPRRQSPARRVALRRLQVAGGSGRSDQLRTHRRILPPVALAIARKRARDRGANRPTRRLLVRTRSRGASGRSDAEHACAVAARLERPHVDRQPARLPLRPWPCFSRHDLAALEPRATLDVEIAVVPGRGRTASESGTSAMHGEPSSTCAGSKRGIAHEPPEQPIPESAVRAPCRLRAERLYAKSVGGSPAQSAIGATVSLFAEREQRHGRPDARA